jgi:hypothetical protein
VRLASCWQGIKSKNVSVGWLGKLFFPGHAQWEQRRKTIILLWSITTGVVVGGLIVLILSGSLLTKYFHR